MKPSILFSLAAFASLSFPASAETVIKVLHIVENQKAREIWRAAADRYEQANPGVKVEFDYLENEAFKAKLPTDRSAITVQHQFIILESANLLSAVCRPRY